MRKLMLIMNNNSCEQINEETTRGGRVIEGIHIINDTYEGCFTKKKYF